MLRNYKSDWLGRLALDLDRFHRCGIVENRDLVAILVAALVNNLLHLCGGSFRKRKCLDGQIVALGADGDLGNVGVLHVALKLDLSSSLRFWFYRVYDDGDRSIHDNGR